MQIYTCPLIVGEAHCIPFKAHAIQYNAELVGVQNERLVFERCIFFYLSNKFSYSGYQSTLDQSFL